MMTMIITSAYQWCQDVSRLFKRFGLDIGLGLATKSWVSHHLKTKT